MAEKVNLICTGCSKEFERLAKTHRVNTKAGKPPYCTRACFHANKGPYKKACPSVEVNCEVCKILFKKPQSRINITAHNFCSLECCGVFNKTSKLVARIELTCPTCKKLFYRRHKYILFRKNTRKNLFCSRPCIWQYLRENPKKYKDPKPKTGMKRNPKRSYLELYVEKKLHESFPLLERIFCGKHNGWELDIQFPTLKFAIEINGIWHYKPIRGEEKLIKIQNRDKIKAEVCKLTGVELFILPVLENVVYKPAFEKYWKIVYDKIIEKTSPVGIEPTT